MEEEKWKGAGAHVVFISTQDRLTGKGLRLQQAGLSQTYGEKLPDSIGYMTRGRDYQGTLWNCYPTDTLKSLIYVSTGN